MVPKTNYKTVFVIIILSSLIGLLFNFFYSGGIPLIRKAKEIAWVKDSVLQLTYLDSLSSNSNSTADPGKKKEDLGNGKWKIVNGKGDKLFVIKQNIESGEDREQKVSNPGEKPGKPSFITLNQAYKLFKTGEVLFIDARDKWEFGDGHISGAINIPEYNFDKSNPVLKTIPKDKTIVSYCDGDDCEMSVKLADNLFKLGYKKIYIFFGGWKEWKKAGYAVSNE
jgi:rhodanese-related sulfurtransferase